MTTTAAAAVATNPAEPTKKRRGRAPKSKKDKQPARNAGSTNSTTAANVEASPPRPRAQTHVQAQVGARIDQPAQLVGLPTPNVTVTASAAVTQVTSRPAAASDAVAHAEAQLQLEQEALVMTDIIRRTQPSNTAKQYAPKQKLFIEWCASRGFADGWVFLRRGAAPHHRQRWLIGRARTNYSGTLSRERRWRALFSPKS